MNLSARRSLCTLTAAAALVLAIGGAQAQEKAQIADALKTALSVPAAEEVNVRRYDVPPGWATPKHYHTGHMFLYVVEGVGTMETEGQSRTARPGEVLHQLPEKTMVMRNASASERLKFVVFQVGATGAPMVVMVKPHQVVQTRTKGARQRLRFVQVHNVRDTKALVELK